MFRCHFLQLLADVVLLNTYWTLRSLFTVKAIGLLNFIFINVLFSLYKPFEHDIAKHS